MHIRIVRIILSSLNYEIINFEAKELEINLNISVSNQFPKENELIQHINFDLFHEIENPPFKLDFTFIGHYSSEGEGTPTIQEFSKIHAPAYIVPYARELVANITSRMGIYPPLVMPPLNIAEALKEPKDENTTKS